MSKRVLLQERARCLQMARAFFFEKNILEVDTPILSKTAPIDEHIDILSVDLGDQQIGYLHSSPEYAMKRLLCMGSGDIFQMSHVFRKQEVGRLHNVEFTIVEWYRLHMPFVTFMQEAASFCSLFLGALPVEVCTYREIYQRCAHIDPFYASQKELIECIHHHHIDLTYLTSPCRDTCLHLLMGFVIEPMLGKHGLSIITEYPASQAALAMTEERDGMTFANRFEIYYQGIELANGYQELPDPIIQQKRFEEANDKRVLSGKEALPIDHQFLQALKQGLPPCCGVAVGLDRLLLLRMQQDHIKDILPFSWDDV